MTRDDVLTKLRTHRAEWQALGITRLALFGSVARDEASVESDVDLLADFTGRVGFSLFKKQDALAALIGCSVDLHDRRGLHEQRHRAILKDLVDV